MILLTSQDICRWTHDYFHIYFPNTDWTPLDPVTYIAIVQIELLDIFTCLCRPGSLRQLKMTHSTSRNYELTNIWKEMNIIKTMLYKKLIKPVNQSHNLAVKLELKIVVMTGSSTGYRNTSHIHAPLNPNTAL